jgi:hypothetical protein
MPYRPRCMTPAPGMSPTVEDSAIAAEIIRQTRDRGPEKSICPSEVARALAGGMDGPWRPLMGRVRAAALGLARDGAVEILRKGRALPPDQEPHGVIRLRIARGAGPEAGS